MVMPTHSEISELQANYEMVRAANHEQCRLCGALVGCFPALSFHLSEPGKVYAELCCDSAQEGYRGMLHGGISAGLIDSALTNALFSMDVVGVTAQLQLRYRRPLFIHRPLLIHAEVTACRRKLWQVEGRIEQDKQICLSANAVFMPYEESQHDIVP